MQTPLIPNASPISAPSQIPTLQNAFGGDLGIGRWSHYELRNLQPHLSVATDTLAVDGESGSLSFAHWGETTILHLDTVGGMTIGGGGTSQAVLFRLPDGWAFRPRRSVGQGTQVSRMIATCKVLNAGVESDGFMEIGRFGPNMLSIFRDLAATAYANGVTYIFGQMCFENAPDGGA